MIQERGQNLDQVNPIHLLLKPAGHLPGNDFETEFSQLYPYQGRPAKSIWLIVGLSILKNLEGLSDEVLIDCWVCDPYQQVFFGVAAFQWAFLCGSSNKAFFRKRIGSASFEKTLFASVAKTRNPSIFIGTQVFEKNCYDMHTLPDAFSQVERFLGHVPTISLGDRGYRGQSTNSRRFRRDRQHPDTHAQAAEKV